MPGGRPRKSTEELKRSGTARKNPKRIALRAEEPRPSKTPPKMPRGLNSHGKRVWKHAADVLKGYGIFSESFQQPLDLLAETYQRYQEAKAIVEEFGQVIKEKHRNGRLKSLRRNPAMIDLQRAAADLVRLYGALGMLPGELSKIKKGDGGAADGEAAEKEDILTRMLRERAGGN